MKKYQMKDLILKHCVENPYKTITIADLKNKILKHMETYEIRQIVEEINIESEIITIINSTNNQTSAVKKNRYTEKFINQGGFRKLAETEEIERRRNQLKNNFDFQVSKFKYYLFWPLFLFAVLGGIYNGCEIIKNINQNESEKSVTKPELTLEVERLKNKIDKNFKEIEKLKENNLKKSKP